MYQWRLVYRLAKPAWYTHRRNKITNDTFGNGSQSIDLFASTVEESVVVTDDAVLVYPTQTVARLGEISPQTWEVNSSMIDKHFTKNC